MISMSVAALPMVVRAAPTGGASTVSTQPATLVSVATVPMMSAALPAKLPTFCSTAWTDSQFQPLSWYGSTLKGSDPRCWWGSAENFWSWETAWMNCLFVVRPAWNCAPAGPALKASSR